MILNYSSIHGGLIKKMSVLKRLTEGIVRHDVQQQGAALIEKWKKTGLLEGLKNDDQINSMAVLLENQAKSLLTEASAMASGDVEGFAAVAFPIVRRVFGSLIANEVVAVQPMSLPSGLIFFLDFQKQSAKLGGATGDSVFGGQVIASQITGGVILTGSGAESSFYALNNGYSSATSSVAVVLTSLASGNFGHGADSGSIVLGNNTYQLDALVQYDPDFISGTTNVCVFTTRVSSSWQLNRSNLVGITMLAGQLTGSQARRLTTKCNSGGEAMTGDSFTHIRLVTYSNTLSARELDDYGPGIGTNGDMGMTLQIPIDDSFVAGVGLGSIVGAATWDLENNNNIPEIDIRIDSVAVTAKTRKLKVKWSPELGQDLNAYHNLDAEVELTTIMSEEIALELDQEILQDLVKGATASTYYWSRRPGVFVNRESGKPLVGISNETAFGIDFTGNVSQWYETLLEVINDVSAQIHRKTLRRWSNIHCRFP